METTERRFIKGHIEVRQAETTPKIGGVAAVVGVTTDMGWYEEQIAPGAFDSVLAANPDVRCLFNHEDEMILGRTKSGTLKLWVNDDGNLEYECDTDPNSPTHQTVSAAIARGDIDQSSFQFRAKTQTWTESAIYGELGLRIITEFDSLYDVSPVTFPAYEDTEVEMRSLKQYREKLIEEKNLPDEKTEYLKNYYNLIIK